VFSDGIYRQRKTSLSAAATLTPFYSIYFVSGKAHSNNKKTQKHKETQKKHIKRRN